MVRVTTCHGENKGKWVWKSCGYIEKYRATSSLPNVHLNNDRNGFWCRNLTLFDHFYLLTLYFFWKIIESVALHIYLHVGSIYRTCTKLMVM